MSLFLSSFIRCRRQSLLTIVLVWGLVFVGFLLFQPFASAQDEPSGGGKDLVEIEHELSLDFATPHTKWAQPYAGGKTRVLFFAPWFQGSTDGREIIELLQRFDLEADAAYSLGGRLVGDGNPRWYRDPQAGTQRLQRLLEDPYDVFFFNQVGWAALPVSVQEAIRAQVMEGAGIVVVGNVGLPGFVSDSGTAAQPDLPSASAALTVGKGRCVHLPLRSRLEFEWGWETRFDYQMADQGRAILWAAGKEPCLDLTLALPSEILTPKDLPGTRVSVAWDRELPDSEVRVEARRWDGARRLLGVAEFSSQRRAEFELPRLRAGDYRLVAIATSPLGIENWSTLPFTVVSDRQVAGIDLEKDWAEIGETLKGTVHLGGELGARDVVRVELIDKENRVLAQIDTPSSQRKVEFAFEIQPWMPMLVRVEAVLMEAQEEISSAYRFVRITERHQGQFNFVMWNAPSGDLAPYATQSMASLGVTAILQGGPPPLYLSESNLSFVPYAASFRWSSHTLTAMLDNNGIMKNGCLYDEAKMQEWVKTSFEASQVARQHGTLVYSLGDENAVRGGCLSPQCLEAYRAYLSREYGSIGDLNASWGTTYSSFEEVTLSEMHPLPAENAPKWFKEFFAMRLQLNRTDSDREGQPEEQIALGDWNDEIHALQAENFPRWYDRQAFQNTTYVEWCKRFKRAFREIDPHSLTGFEGTDSFTIRRLTTRSRQGGDLDAFVRELEYFGPYEGPANEVVRSIAPPKFPMGNWIGYSMIPNVLLEKTWGQIADGMNTVQWWRCDNLDGYHGFLTPSLALFPEGKELVNDTQVVRDGLGTLLMDCTIHDDSVAMLYSQPSTYIAHFDGNPTYGDYKRDHDLWHQALHQSGLQFRYVTDRMLRLGEFDPKRFKVLILPLAFALGPQEAAVIRAFVQNGGTVIADVRPGIYDGHCKPLEQGILDDVFGIRRTGKQDALGLDRMSVDGVIGGATVSMKWGNWEGKDIYPQMQVDPTVETTTGKELGNAFPIHFWHGLKNPVCVVNEYGLGRAILLNFPIYNAPAQPLIENLLASAGVLPVVRVESPEGSQPVRDVEVTRWENEEIEILALLGTHEGPVNVRLPEGRHVYDLKTHQEIGQASEFSTLLRPHRASVFALLPQAVEDPVFVAEHTSADPGKTVNLKVSLPGAKGKHALKLTASDPWNRPATWLERILILDDQPIGVEVPFAHNDPAGEWKIAVSDLFTGKKVVQALVLKDGPMKP